ncbi:SusC/RagA family TonB-linked outer membrane protein [Sphingobacterium sp. LRF_L2]|uniref:SusC/RagA family TonB-linked outer membrane protein n=1 Tax=Sphingobacterium sp. LRF_L2 TaxID=3369421 RepID=UPI003F5E903D
MNISDCKKNIKIYFTLLCVCLINVVSAQQKINIDKENITLDELLTDLRQQTGYDFVSMTSKFNFSKKINPKFKDTDLEDVLETYFNVQSGVVFVYKDKNIILMDETKAKYRTITGRVSTEKGRDLIQGVTISFLPKAIKTRTNEDGEFSLHIPEYAREIEATFLGYERSVLKLSSASTYIIYLQEKTEKIEDVVVTGLFERPKEMYTGAARSFTQEELQQVTSDNVLTALKSLDPSFQLPENINLGSNPNALPEVTLRGGNSLVDISSSSTNTFNYANSVNTPLFILDGFEVSLTRINDLDITRIKSVNLLKDATATSIYGSRAANGVVVIETIQPKEGQIRITYTGNTTIEMPDLSGYDILNAREKLELEEKAGVYTYHGWNQREQNLAYYYESRKKAIESGVETDWMALPLRTGIGQKHNVYLEGGSNNNALYGVSLNYYDTKGVMKGSDRKTLTGNTFLSYRVKNFQFKNDLTIISNTANNSPYGSFTQYAQLNPYWTPYNEDGSLKLYLEEVYDNSGNRLTLFDSYDNLDGYVGRPTNPLYNATLGIVDQSRYKSFVNNFSAQWQVKSWLRLNGTFAYQYQADESDEFLPAQHTSFSATTTLEKGSYDKAYGKRSGFEGNLSANLNRSIGRNLFFATLGGNLQQTKYDTELFSVIGFPNANLKSLTQGLQYPSGTSPEGSESYTRLAGLFANGSYAYDSKYLLDVSYRLDGSSQFGKDNRMAPFWSLGAGWNLEKETFMKNIDWLNRFKLRYSLGYTGSQNFASYLGTSTSRYYNDSEYRGIMGTYLLSFGNSALSWQKTRKNNLGLDLTVFNKLNISANYYIENTEGSIATISSAPSTGFSTYSENIGDLNSKGWEAYFRYNVINDNANRNNLSVFLNLVSVKNKISRISNTIAKLNETADTTYSSRPVTKYEVGQSTTAIWAVPSLGIDPATGREIYLTRDGKITNTYDPVDQIIVGDTRSKIEGTFGANLEIKGVGLNAYFRFQYGGQAYNQTLVERVENVNVDLYNVDRRVAEERWLQPGDITFFKGLLDERGVSISDPTYATSRFVQDNNLLSLESLSVYYRFKDTFNRRCRLSNTRITAFTSDVFRISSIKRERGLDYPFSRTFTLQLSTSF